MKRRVFIILTLLALLLGGVSLHSLALSDFQEPGGFVSDTITYINPLYADQVEELPEDQLSGIRFAADPPQFTTEADAAVYVRQMMKQRITTFQLKLRVEDSDYAGVMRRVANLATAHTGVPTEGDYLLWQFKKWTGNVRYYESDQYDYTFTYQYEYYTTLAQEAEVDAAVQKLRQELQLAEKGDFEKFRAVYDYMTQNIVYDTGDYNGYLKHTAYAALIQKTAVCQGYATLLYRLMLEEGIDCRLISGIGNGAAHGWNIVKLGDCYFNVDVTWDAQRTGWGSDYRYCLRNDASFTNHTRDDPYKTAEFYEAYTMTAVDHPREHVLDITPAVAATCIQGGWTAASRCTVCEEILAEREMVPATGHQFLEDAVCGHCGEKKLEPERLPTGKFRDVQEETLFYYTPVYWALSQGITTGVSEREFGPDDTCTRGQVVTFLWRAAGSPKVTAGQNPFVDLETGAYYYDAVLWAVEQGITKGTSESEFSPDLTVTRDQFVTFLYRYAGQPEVSGDSSFSDVPAGQFYTEAVIWAADRDVTKGTGNGKFSPGDPCSRGQVVTFLFRHMTQ